MPDKLIVMVMIASSEKAAEFISFATQREMTERFECVFGMEEVDLSALENYKPELDPLISNVMRQHLITRRNRLEMDELHPPEANS